MGIFPLPGAYLISQALQCGIYWRATVKRVRHLFESKRKYSHISKLCLLIFQTINNYHYDVRVLDVPQLLFNFILSYFYICSICILI